MDFKLCEKGRLFYVKWRCKGEPETLGFAQHFAKEEESELF